jgi:hypothetical protein
MLNHYVNTFIWLEKSPPDKGFSLQKKEAQGVRRETI